MSDIIDWRSGRPLSRVAASRRQLEGLLAERRVIPIGTRCRAVGGPVVVTVTAAPDARGNHPVRLTLADGQTRDFMLPAISLTPVKEDADAE